MSTILIVDDVWANRRSLTTLLSGQGHRFVEAANGREGLDAVRDCHPDLIITDVLMPVMNGYEFVRQLRLQSATAGIPVLFYTAPYSEREARAWAESGGGSYILRKPAAADDVQKIVAQVLSGKPPREAEEGAGPAGAEPDHGDLRLMSGEPEEHIEDLRVANARSRAVINIGLEIASQRDADKILSSVCVAAHDLFGASYVTLGIVDQVAGVVQRFHACGIDDSYAATHTTCIKVGDAVAGFFQEVMAQRLTRRGDNPTGDPAALHLPACHPPVQFFLTAPIASPTQVYGWICLVGNEGRPFTADDEQLLKALSGQVGRIYEIEHEVTERKTAELCLRQERDRAQRYLDTAEVILLALDLQGNITLINRAGCALLGWTERELVGRSWIDTCLPAGTRSDFRDKLTALNNGALPSAENLVLTKTGGERLVDWRNTPLCDDAGAIMGTLSSGTDITERRSLERQYQHAQKMEAVGMLAGGVAHDFNNLLTAILGYCELVQDKLEPGDQRFADVGEIRKAGKSAAGLTRQLLAFSRKEIIEPTLLNLNDVVAGIRALCGRLIEEDISVVLQTQPDLALVKADRGQIEQVLVNLAVNARDAMPGGGTLTIATADVELDAAYSMTHPGVTPGRFVKLTMTDTGAGIPLDVRARLFEPFFTTKEPGKGTGLGLAIVHSIVTQSGGSVDVSTEVGAGTSFCLYFPVAGAGDAIVPVASAPLSTAAGTQTLLVVDDAEGLRDLAKRMLERLGYTVLVAANGDEAIRLFEQHPAIAVLLTDIVMPGISGLELSKRLTDTRPSLPVVYMSGYGEDTIARHGILNPGLDFLHKPFTSETLGRKVREALERHSVMVSTPPG
jgi:PAS domain S-box-containing protein